MKLQKHIVTAALLTGLVVGMPGVHADGTNSPGNSTNAVVKPYPLDYCLVSGDKLGGDMGKPIIIVYKGQEFKFCCSDCPPKFKKKPDKYMKELHEAEKQGASDKK